MSKAFTSEETPDLPDVVAPRAPLPAGVPNYVTARGLALLRAELEALPADSPRRMELGARIASAELVPPPTESLDSVRFGATVELRADTGVRRYRIVGVDEAEPERGLVAFTSPLARALLGRRAGETVRLRAPRGDEELEIAAVGYAEDP